MTPGANPRNVEICFQPRVEVAMTLYRSLRLVLGLGLNGYLMRPKYTVDTAEGKKVVFDPLSIQPMGTVGLSIGFF